MVAKMVSAKFESADLEMRLYETLKDFFSVPRYLVKVTEHLFDTDALIELAAHVVNADTSWAVDVSSKREERIKILAQAVEKKVSFSHHCRASPRQRISSMTEPTQKAYFEP